jgi:hypothetical protein
MSLLEKENMNANLFPENSILEGKQPGTINWHVFLEKQKDNLVFLEIYNIDKENHPALVRKMNLSIDTVRCPTEKCVIAKGDGVCLYMDNGELFLNGWTKGIIKLNSDSENIKELNWCRNKSCFDFERQKIIHIKGYWAAPIIDSIYRKDSLNVRCSTMPNKEFLTFIKEHTMTEINREINEKENQKKMH